MTKTVQKRRKKNRKTGNKKGDMPSEVEVDFPVELSNFKSIEENGTVYINKRFTFFDSPKKT